MTAAEAIKVAIPDRPPVSAIIIRPSDAKACLVFAHGAGAGMTHSFMTDIANSLAAVGIATLRFQFPYMEKGSKRPDAPPVAHEAVRAAVAGARHLMPDLPLFAGGKSFGGRMTSQAQAIAPLAARGLVFFGFPLHPAGKPSIERAEHLKAVSIPTLFLQGDRDALADITLLKPILAAKPNAELLILEGASHALEVPKRLRGATSTSDLLSTAVRAWIDRVLA